RPRISSAFPYTTLFRSVRRRNLYDPKGALNKRCTTHYGMTVEDCITADIFDRLEKSSDYRARLDAVVAFNAKNTILKKGIALTPDRKSTRLNSSHVKIS